MRKNEAPPGRSGRDAASTLDIAEVLLRVVRDARRLLQGKVTSLMLERGGGFETVASDGAGRAYLSREPPAVRNSVSGRVLQSGQPITVQDVLSEPCFHRVDVAQAEGLVSLLSVPLRTKHRIIGVLNLLNLLVEQFGGRLHASTDRVVGGVVVQIRDTGPRVAREVLDRLFEPFVTTRVGRTGLGLPIFHRIIEGHRHSRTPSSFFSARMPVTPTSEWNACSSTRRSGSRTAARCTRPGSSG